MKKLPIKDKIFWKNFIQYILIFCIFVFLFSFRIDDNSGKTYFHFLEGYIIVSFFCILYLGVKIGQEFSKCEDIDEKRNEYLKKGNIDIREFRKKYKDIINIYDSSENWLIEDSPQKNDVYEYINEAGEKKFLTLGNKSNGKFDIYWEDIIASKNNKKEIVTVDGKYIIEISDFDPLQATEFVNKFCPLCGTKVDRFFYIDNFSKKNEEYGDDGWMEVCFKCNKLIYLDTSLKE